MTMTRLKAKNQVTLPAEIIKRLGLKTDELFAVDVEANYLKLTPVKLEPRYSVKELETIDRILEREKPKAKVVIFCNDFLSFLLFLPTTSTFSAYQRQYQR